MEIAEVQDNASLRRYLKALPEGEQREVSVRVAYCAAARVLPIAALEFATSQHLLKRDSTAAPIFGCVAIAAVAAVSPTAAIELDAYATNAATTNTTTAARATNAEIWETVRLDLRDSRKAALWKFAAMPLQLIEDWGKAKIAMIADEKADWSFGSRGMSGFWLGEIFCPMRNGPDFE